MVISKTKLLKMPEVVNEVSRHLWFESEKAGYDVGREHAQEDWYKKYAKEWIKHNLPQEVAKPKRKTKSAKTKKRRAKSYTA